MSRWGPRLAILLYVTLMLSGNVLAAGSSVPTNWTSADIGTVGQPGSASFDPEFGRWTINGAGADIWGTADSFHYLYRPLTGDWHMLVRVLSVENTHPFAKAGIMVRESLDPNSRHVMVNVRPNGTWEFLTRLETGGITRAAGGPGAGVPRGLHLRRDGNLIQAQILFSSGGWISVGSVTFAAPETIFVGAAVTSHDPATTNTSTFEGLNVWNPGDRVPPPWTTQDVGATGVPGDAQEAAVDIFEIRGAGADIWGTADAFRYVSQAVRGDVDMVVRVPWMDNTHTFAKAGLMLRESMAPGSAHVILDVRPNGEIEFMTRRATDQTTSFIAGGRASVPVWLRLTRSGASVTGAFSVDGRSWTQWNVTTPMSADAHIGMAVTSHDPAVLNHSRFENVGVVHLPSEDPIVVYAGDVRASDIHGMWVSQCCESGSPDGVNLVTADIGYSSLERPLASPEHYVDVTFDARPGVPYTFWLRMRAANNSKWNDSVWVQFSDVLVNGSPAGTYRINTASGLLVNLATNSTASSLNGWGWANGAYWLTQPATVTFQNGGAHTMRIQLREDGVAVDQIVLSSGRYLNTPPGPPTNDRTIVPRAPSSSPPTAPSSPNPADGATGVSRGPTLTWVATGATSYDISFGTTNPPPFVHSKTAAFYTPVCECGEGAPRPLEYSTRYFWQITARNANGSTPGPVWSFTTMANPNPPSSPFGPDPPDGDTVVSTTATLSWNAQNATTFDVKFGKTDPPPLVSAGQTSRSYRPAVMDEDTRYFWQIIAHNANGSTPGAVWSFTTGPSTPPPPAAPSSPVPADGATNVGATGTMDWSAAGATSHDVYYGTTNPPPYVVTVVNPFWTPPTRTRGTKYYWQIVARNKGGQTPGPVWSFTTAP
jgi:hypothetical protein